MNRPVFFSTLAVLACAAPALQAQESGRVLSSVPVIQQVAVPRQVCNNYPVVVEQPRSGAGALLGAIAGGAAGNAIGDGGGRAVATALGLLGGAVLGDRIEGPNAQLQQHTQCSTQTTYENRAVSYQVTYEYAGRQYSVQLPYDPGPTIALQILPAGAGYTPPPQQSTAPLPAPVAPIGSAQALPQDLASPTLTAPSSSPPVVILRELVPPPMVVPHAYGVMPAPAYGMVPAPAYGMVPAPFARPYYYPPRVSLHLGYVRGGHRHRHRGWH
ncbi:hypothetical protein WG922_12245 [Ramlibacter sp. AN1015]|uniref:hypothetical protein n=1 Tax=Ramlibacter sp. AN1015 TaxID=3133428 RepID=UPI0030BDD9F7